MGFSGGSRDGSFLSNNDLSCSEVVFVGHLSIDPVFVRVSTCSTSVSLSYFSSAGSREPVLGCFTGMPGFPIPKVTFPMCRVLGMMKLAPVTSTVSFYYLPLSTACQLEFFRGVLFYSSFIVTFSSLRFTLCAVLGGGSEIGPVFLSFNISGPGLLSCGGLEGRREERAGTASLFEDDSYGYAVWSREVN